MRSSTTWKVTARRLAVGAAQAVQRTDPYAAYFNSFQGRYSDNPRAVFEALQQRRPDLNHVWRVESSHAASFPPGVATVEGGTWEHVKAVGRARYVVTNDWMGSHPKPPGTVWLQTWHGTPLKRIALDRDLPQEKVLTLQRDVAKWDYLVSPNPFSTEIFRRAFGYTGEVLEVGYPRNDVLSAEGAGAARQRVRHRLGISDDRIVVLYAPTWRDTAVSEGGKGETSLFLDADRLTAEIGDTHTLLLRLHYFIAPTFADTVRGASINVSRHPDIRDLYLAADVLVTDYSSAMFDFAITGKPMLFLAPDLASYRDDMRGFYFDFEQLAPGPIVETTAEVVEQLRSLGAVQQRFAGRYSAFRERFCALEDGGASARVVDAVFGDAGR